jgi:hypothetical protein
MKQIYHKYVDWEDYKNGMYRTNYKNEDELIDRAKKLLSNEDEFYSVSLDMINDWVISSDVNLSNKGHNRRSWIGQAACCYECETPESLTRVAWGELDNETKRKANLVADKIIRIYEEKYRRLYQNVGESLLF